MTWLIYSAFSGIYGWIFLPSGWLSIDVGASNGTTTTNVALESIHQTVGAYNYFALAMFLIMQFCVSVGVSSVPYFLLSEVFPFKWVPFLPIVDAFETKQNQTTITFKSLKPFRFNQISSILLWHRRSLKSTVCIHCHKNLLWFWAMVQLIGRCLLLWHHFRLRVSWNFLLEIFIFEQLLKWIL